MTVPARYAPTPADAPEGLTAKTPAWPVDHFSMAVAVRKATSGYSEPRARVIRLLGHLNQSVRYGGEMGTRDGVLKVLERGVGRCWDRSDVLVTYCRAAGIPTRQVAGWVPPLDAGHVWVEVYVDGGIMNGADIVAAIALGADAAFFGRAYLYGIMAGGEDGVQRATDILIADVIRTMKLLGVTSLDELTPDHVRLP